MLSPGARAVQNGADAEKRISDMLRSLSYIKADASTIPSLAAWTDSLFPTAGRFARHVNVELSAHYMKRGRKMKVDFAVIPKHLQTVLLSIKYQERSGSAGEKLEFEGQQLIATCTPSALIVFGNGFCQSVLEEVWERLKHHSKQLFLFRRMSSVERWAEDGFPVPDEQRAGMTYSRLFEEYCDLRP